MVAGGNFDSRDLVGGLMVDDIGWLLVETWFVSLGQCLVIHWLV